MDVKELAEKTGAVAGRAGKAGALMLSDRIPELREESPYFQAKVAVWAAWLVVSVLTLWLAPPAPVPFIVEARAVSFGLSDKTNVIILNNAGGDLVNARVEVQGAVVEFDGKTKPGTWTTKPIAIPEGRKVTLSTEWFFDDKGRNPGYQLKAETVTITDAKGKVRHTGPPTQITDKNKP
jgi:hypothetical protein